MSKRKPQSEYLQAYMAKLEDLAVLLPNFMGMVNSGEMTASGLSIFLGDSNDWVGCVRAFDSEGAPVICWSSGNDVVSCLMNLDRALEYPKWKPDKYRQKK